MSSSVLSLGTTASQGTAAGAVVSKTAMSSPWTSIEPSRDVISLSRRAQDYVQALELLQTSDDGDPDRSTSASLNLQRGSASVSVASGSAGASASIFVQSMDGATQIEAVANGSAEGNDVIDMSVFTAGESFIDGRGEITLGDGNDTVTVSTNGLVNIGAGDGNDIITASSTGDGFVQAAFGSGTDTADLYGGGEIVGGSGDDVVNLHTTSDSSVLGIAVGGSGTTTINGAGTDSLVFGGSGTTIVNNVGDTILGTGTAVVNLSNSAYSSVQIGPTFGSSVINLSDPASGVVDDTRPYAQYAQGIDNKTHLPIPVVRADANGDYSGRADSYEDVLPSAGQAGFAQAHAYLDFRNLSADQFTSEQQGSTLVLTVAATGQSLTINNYEPGRITFSFMDDSGGLNASRTPPGS